MKTSGRTNRIFEIKSVFFISIIGIVLIMGFGTLKNFFWQKAQLADKRNPDVAKIIDVDFRSAENVRKIPFYIDVNIGDIVRIVKSDSSTMLIPVQDIEIENGSNSSPRTKVMLSINGKSHTAYCGMQNSKNSGLAPLRIDGIKIGIEITRLLFSDIGKFHSSEWNSFANFRLQKDLRMAIWEDRGPILQADETAFVVNQPTWTKAKFGNWLHRTKYGFHSAIDIFATRNGTPEPVISPINGKVYKVYNKGGDPNSLSQKKVVNIHGEDPVGPNGELIFLRLVHLSKISVSTDQIVKVGQIIGYTGHTGFAPHIGDHLHFEIRLNPSCFGLAFDDDIFATIPVNPYNYLLEWWEDKHKLDH